MSNSPKYAVMIPLEEAWLYVTEGDSKFQLRTKLFDSFEEAKKLGELYGVYKIVEYNE